MRKRTLTSYKQELRAVRVFADRNNIKFKYNDPEVKYIYSMYKRQGGKLPLTKIIKK